MRVLARLTAPLIEVTAKEAGISIAEMCKRSGTARATFYRWRKGGASPTIGTIDKWLDVLEKVGQKQEG